MKKAILILGLLFSASLSYAQTHVLYDTTDLKRIVAVPKGQETDKDYIYSDSYLSVDSCFDYVAIIIKDEVVAMLTSKEHTFFFYFKENCSFFSEHIKKISRKKYLYQSFAFDVFKMK